jgi:hypothetical protein
MKAYVLDTSVAVAWYLDEAFSPAPRLWIDRMVDGKATR